MQCQRGINMKTIKEYDIDMQLVLPQFMYEGIWIGANARTEEVLTGTGIGAAKCRTS